MIRSQRDKSFLTEETIKSQIYPQIKYNSPKSASTRLLEWPPRAWSLETSTFLKIYTIHVQQQFLKTKQSFLKLIEKYLFIKFN